MIEIKGIDPQMIANNLEPFEPVHPEDLLKEEIEYRGISQRKLAAQMGVSYTMFNEILNTKRPLTIEIAMLVEAALGIDSGLLVRMQLDYNMLVAKKDKTFVQRLAKVRKIAAVL